MRRAVIMSGSPHLENLWLKGTAALFEETGGNTGNLAFRYGLASHTKNVAFSRWDAPVAEIRAAGDVLLLPLANQLGSHTDLGDQAERIEAIGLPVVGIGLGAQAPSHDVAASWTAGTERWLRTLIAHAPSDQPNLGVRGAYTLEQIDRLGLADRVAVTGCPSNFLNMRDDLAPVLAARYDRRPEVVAVAAGIPYIPAMQAVEQQLAQLVTDTGGAYIVQHGLEMLHLARGEFAALGSARLELCRSYIRPELSVAEFTRWCRTHAYAFFHLPSWLEFLRRFDFVVGSRFHGAMLALQVGVPAGVIAHDSRTREMCQTMGVPVRLHTEIDAPLTAENLPSLFAFDPQDFRARRRTLHAAYCQLFADAQLEMVAPLRSMF